MLPGFTEGSNLLFGLGVKEDPKDFYHYDEQLRLLRQGLGDSPTRLVVVKVLGE